MCPPNEAAAIEAETPDDSGASDLDSLYDSEGGSVMDTLNTLAKTFQFEFGRQYDAQRKWFIPVDEEQKESMDIYSEMCRRAIGGKLYLAPIAEKPQRVVDIATGTGIWAVEFAEEHPSAQVIGTDLAPIQPSWVPPNCEFQVDDATQTWTFTKGSFDFIHTRQLHAAINDWVKFSENAFAALKPGGWLEIVGEDVELFCDDGTLPEDNSISQWMKDSIDATVKVGINLQPYYTMREPVKAAGFDMSTYNHSSHPIPVGTWPKKREEKELGCFALAYLLQGIEGFALGIYTGLIGKTEQEVKEVLLPQWYKDLKNKRQHKYMKLNVIYVQKPLTA